MPQPLKLPWCVIKKKKQQTLFGLIREVRAEFSKFAGMLSAALPQHHILGFEIAQLEFHHLTSFVHSEYS